MIGTDGEKSTRFEKRTYAEVALSKIETQKIPGPETWVRCGYVSRCLCNCWEVHPRGKLRWFANKNLIPGKEDVGGYIVTHRTWRRRCRTLSMHRICLETFFPKPHPILECDHRDDNRKNWDIRNLRWVTHQQNQYNRRQRKSRGLPKGVKAGKKYRAMIGGKHIGT